MNALLSKPASARTRTVKRPAHHTGRRWSNFNTSYVGLGVFFPRQIRNDHGKQFEPMTT
jgi:hypothetical protein